NTETSAWAFARLDADGTLDTTFGNGGIKLFDPGVASYQALEALDFTVLTDGSLVAVGIMRLKTVTNLDIGVFKLTANGNLDTSWGNDGGQIIPYDLADGGSDAPIKIVEDGQGRFLVVGFSSVSSTSFTTVVTRLTADGELDSSFGLGGKLT